MSKKKSLMSAVMAGLLLGGAHSAQAISTSNGDTALTNGDNQSAVIYVALDKEEPGDKHSCKGLNSCKGKGGCKADPNKCKAGSNSCKGKGACATAKHDCKGKNACKGQGGCKSGDNKCAAKNSCKGKGGCASPVKHT
eukprot:TRINITY_DN7308_c1_g1_i1.p1 TRINITY_DN7308_c1_g1~~TRINITY_DN7308_c1_g1_i1.p1  ORF type:complete len:162 (-),score=16.76 TRINITY_DN7308_c1_g1_i1:128-541(-)